MNRRGWIGSGALTGGILLGAAGLAAWKHREIEANAALAASQPEPMESIAVAVAREHRHRETTAAIGTVLALRSVSLRNEVAGLVERVLLRPGAVVDEGDLLVALDVSVEEAELRAREAQAALAETLLERVERASRNQAVATIEVDRARAERDVAVAEIARIRAIIDRKTIRAPFPARVGLTDIHPGQYLEAGTLLTTLQGVDDAVHVDFAVPQSVVSALDVGQEVEVSASLEPTAEPLAARIVAIDARVDPGTRNALVRARLSRSDAGRAGTTLPAPGSSVRVRVPVGPAQEVVVVPVAALRKGPSGDHVFVIEPEPEEPARGRARLRRVESGAMLGDRVVIRSGLRAGEVVAASGSFKLREGALVAAAESPAAVLGRAD